MITLKNNWSESTKAYEPATSLKGDARGIVTDLEPEMRLDYKYLVAELTSRFEPANQANMYKAQMNSLIRKQGQVLSELAQEIKRITRLAYPTAPIDIRDQEPKTIGDCVRVGVEYEAFVVDQKRLTNTKPAIRMQHETPFEQIDNDNNILGQIAKMSHQLDDLAKFQNSNDYSGVTCFFCGVTFQMENKLVVNTRMIGKIILYSTAHHPTRSKGATFCIIHPRKFDALPPEAKSLLKINKRKLCIANGDSIRTLGTIDLPVKIGGSTVTQKFTVADIDAPALLEYDFLHKYKCNLDLGFGILTINGIKINCMKLSQMPSIFKVSINEKMTIPTHTEMIVNATIQGDSSHVMDAIVEPVMSNQTKSQVDELKQVLARHKGTFSKSKDDLGRATAIRHRINTGTATPVKLQPSRLPFHKTEEADKEVQRLLDCGIIEPSKSNWSTSRVLVNKKDSSKRIYTDFRILNRHLGIHKTVARVRRRFYWVHFKADILKWIQQCTMCTFRKQPPRRAKSKMKQYHIGAPMERVALDIIGPFPLSKKGNKYALIVSDYFTRWNEGYPMPDMETKTIIDNFANNFVCRFGVPIQIHTDQGRQFESVLFKELCTRICIDKTRTTPYRPQSDGSNQRDWDEQLPLAFMAYRSSVYESTKFSPCKLMLGREIELPIDLIYGPHPQQEEFNNETQAVNEHMIQITQNMWKVHEKASKNMVNASESQKKQYDIKSYQHSYQTGNVVWLYTPTRVKNVSPKLQIKWDSPYFIVTVLSDVTYKIQKNQSSRSQVVRHDRLKQITEK
ncbi:unnamed protein product [Mytilus coruscus]|uniref:Integrase catalytic domain-containing protein n=1 Tax=Mytilus coruscus TaxID=42192 RepID=A0A6J8AGF5_MYTCO|nr:unnamed protein product [Mytilus coruscus]